MFFRRPFFISFLFGLVFAKKMGYSEKKDYIFDGDLQ